MEKAYSQNVTVNDDYEDERTTTWATVCTRNKEYVNKDDKIVREHVKDDHNDNENSHAKVATIAHDNLTSPSTQTITN